MKKLLSIKALLLSLMLVVSSGFSVTAQGASGILSGNVLAGIGSLSTILGPNWNPLNLYKTGEQGVWYDPSDFSRYMQTGPELVQDGEGINTSGWTQSLGAGGSFVGAGGEFT